ncbi:MAG: glycerol-3-phosphate 1-O-acyltransferase PlsY [Cytophagaceae bacterium]|nr:glycerol-3-phosphate 1-O-acyltransferase PlsY [Cytophagaceae bacterium]MDW8455692.1 glycerol-3-phosphate 1-O-acyltransferase PlsY [Cytophagaceae bacterium]
MASWAYITFGTIVAYLLGSFPTAVWYGKLYHGIDIRDYGSGNAGATNTFRILGRKAGTIVMIIDIFKGWLATQSANLLVYYALVEESDLVVYKLIFGMAAVFGHIFPVFAGFRGGKGIATLLGMTLSIHIEAAFICLVVFMVVLLLSKYVSLGSMVAALAFPIILFSPRFRPEEHGPLVIAFGFAIFSIVMITHQKNIKRLINGEENKARLRIGKKNQV